MHGRCNRPSQSGARVARACPIAGVRSQAAIGIAAEVVSDEQQARLAALFAGLDPVRLLRQIDRLQVRCGTWW
ncbi:hypothetical protein EYB53_000430 [Candidatus Chloroploca sp. M-50]|uniref:Uncharacterized protein n=1 Tax=Candidatus Chloroploca mongolica TaxID=2528176 RepID=A0ABS4D3Z4_9CHLR|nr:hypothetical protein [Candidatus Chloroploca mongolica]MBP1464161.1 hypothetical protein [Candidatus Chloroploca mongolica]